MKNFKSELKRPPYVTVKQQELINRKLMHEIHLTPNKKKKRREEQNAVLRNLDEVQKATTKPCTLQEFAAHTSSSY